MSETDKSKILIVDDLPDKLLVLTSVLEELVENLITARSGEAKVLTRAQAVVRLP